MSTLEKTSKLDKFFGLKEHNTNVKTEVLAGITTFLTMAYILAVNPNFLSAAGMDASKVFTATALASCVGTLVMALFAKLPFALAPGMGLNAMFAFTVCGTLGFPYQFGLLAVFVEGIIFILLSIFNVREAIIDSIPMSLKKAISVGIGLFIAFIGLLNAEVVVTSDGILKLGNITSGSGLLALIGIAITGILLARKVKGALLIGILATTIIGIPMGVTITEGFKAVSLPSAPYFFDFAAEGHTVLSMLKTPDFYVVLFIFLFVDMFDTIGTLVGVCTKANMLTEDGKVPNAKKALLSDAVATLVGAIFGTSTVTTFVESSSGVSEGGRTGLTSLVVAILFAVSLLFSGIFGLIPSAATAPALVLVGLFMMSPIKEINLDDFTEGIPAFIAIIMMPFAYSIAEGITYGVLSYVIIKLAAGRHKDIHVGTYVIAAIFIVKIIVNALL